jgi:tetratricopeptide (TPR) repeat protein
MIRKLLLSALVLAFILASGVAGYFALRNRAADKLAFILTARGVQLSKQQADKLERDLEVDPNSFADRIELLSFYSFKRVSGELNASELASRRRHIAWVITNEPSSKFASDPAMEFYPETEDPDPVGLQEARSLWLQQVQAKPSDSRILYNTGEFFSSIHEFPQSEDFLERARAIDPADYETAFSLATDYWHDARYSTTSDQLRISAIKSLGLFEQALKNAKDNDQVLYTLPDAAQAAFEAGDSARAAAWSTEMLTTAEKPENGRDYSDEVHYGNIVLGRIALRQGDTTSAAAHLIKAGAVGGNPHLDSFGPNMMLAKELLERGTDQPVLEYLDACSKFWKSDDGKLARWRAAVVTGKAPDFGANLRY